MQNYTVTFFFTDIFFHCFRRLVTYDFIPWENIPAYINSVHNNNCQRAMAVVSISVCEKVLQLDFNATRVPSYAVSSWMVTTFTAAGKLLKSHISMLLRQSNSATV